MDDSTSQIKIFRSLKDIQKSDWGQITYSNFPFADYEYLSALETSRSVGPGTGWDPLYLTVWKGESLLGATYLYLKDNSYGEYIFDWEWAQAYQRMGVAYYPKLMSAVPFTPATGPKLLISTQAERKTIVDLLIQGMKALYEEMNCSSIHSLFLTKEETKDFSEQDYFIRHSFQYHWRNRGFRDFPDFLDTLRTKKRKQIVKERDQLKNEGIEIRTITGEEIQPHHAEQIYRFYLSTIYKMGAHPYLTENFFQTVMETMKDRLVLMMASRKGTEIAGTINYHKGSHLYGRYWGADEEVKNLHFELCYYQTIEYAIRNRIELFEAGAQGEHKIPRGFLPELTYSAHWIRHPAFRNAIREFIDKEKSMIGEIIEEMAKGSPYR